MRPFWDKGFGVIRISHSLRWVVVVVLVATVGVACEPKDGSNTLVVTSMEDGGDAVPGDGVCEMSLAVGDCSLRAAIDESNANDEIFYVDAPAGRYTLAGGVDDDSNGFGDLDVSPASGTLAFSGRGVVIDAAGSSRAIDARSGLVIVSGFNLTGASVAAATARSGANLLFFSGGIFRNLGDAFVVEHGAFGQLRNVSTAEGGSGVRSDGDLLLSFVTTFGPFTGSGTFRVTGSIVDDSNPGDCAPNFVSMGWNAFTGSGCAQHPTDIVVPAIATHPFPVDGAIGSVNEGAGFTGRDHIPEGEGPCVSGPLAIDQHGTNRPLGAGCDLGAFETLNEEIVVNTASDTSDASATDERCADSYGTCSLRAAFEEVNNRHAVVQTAVRIAPGINPVMAPDGPVPSTTDGPLVVDAPVWIVGGGATVALSGRTHAFVIRYGFIQVDDIRFTDANSPEGVIRSESTDPYSSLYLNSVSIEARGGRAIDFSGFEVSIRNSTVADAGDVVIVGANVVIEASYFDRTGATLTARSLGRLTGSTVGGENGLRLASGGSWFVDTSTISGAATTGVHVDGTDAFLGSVTIASTSVALHATNNADVYVAGSAAGGACSHDASSTMTVATTFGCSTIVDMLIGPLGVNGGQVPTHLPLPGSPLVDAYPVDAYGRCGIFGGPDQNGVERPQGSMCDNGAVELPSSG